MITTTTDEPEIKGIDMLSGWGGFTQGAEMAGVRIVFGLNHSETAIEGYRYNHPRARAVCGDARHYDYRELPGFDLLIASPSCRPGSNASQPARKKMSERLRQIYEAERVTPWCLVDCLEVCRPRMFAFENIVEMLDWELYQRWKGCLMDLGYGVAEHRLLASRHGVPQRRVRLFLTGVLRKPALRYADPKVREPAIGPHLQWNTGDWRPIDELSDTALDRVARGRARCGRRFITQHVTRHPGIPLNEPIRTITTCDQYALVDGNVYRPLTVRETARAMGFPDAYGWPEHIKRRKTIEGLGNAVCPPVARDIITALLHHEGNTPRLRAA